MLLRLAAVVALTLTFPTTSRADASPQQAVAVFPVSVVVADLDPTASSTLLTNALTLKLTQQEVFTVISADEVAALVQNEANRIQMGCEETCLAELAGALGARLLVTGEVNRVGSTLVWSVSLIDQSNGTVVRRVSVKGRSVQSLNAQAEEVANVIAGKSEQLVLEGEGAQERLGFVDKKDFREFVTYRNAVPQLSTSDALTQFIIERNSESPRLAVLEAGLLSSAALLAAAAGVILVMFGPLAAFNDVANSELEEPVNLWLAGHGALLGAVALGLGVAGFVVVIWDLLDIGAVRVRSDGCCRDDSRIVEAARDDSVQRASALAVVLSSVGAVALIPIFLVGILVPSETAITGLQLFENAQGLKPGTLEPPFTLRLIPGVPTCPCLPICGLGTFAVVTCWPLVVGAPLGLGLLLRPGPAPVEDVSEDEGGLK
ncbi:MAG: hypothetical protein AB2A00_24355 [Myxococcota bacterium]